MVGSPVLRGEFPADVVASFLAEKVLVAFDFQDSCRTETLSGAIHIFTTGYGDDIDPTLRSNWRTDTANAAVGGSPGNGQFDSIYQAVNGSTSAVIDVSAVGRKSDPRNQYSGRKTATV